MQTEVPWLFAAGNNIAVFDLVDSVAAVGEIAGRSAALFAQGKLKAQRSTRLVRGENVLHLVPTSLIGGEEATKIYLRASHAMQQATLHIGDVISKNVISRKLPVVRPSEMIEVRISQEEMARLTGQKEVRIEVIEV